MRIVVIGSGGQVGFEAMRAVWPAGVTAVGLSHVELDITDESRVAEAISTRPWDLAINLAAYTAVDRAEQEPTVAFAVNRDGAACLARACAAAGIPLLHLSTDYVFDGSKLTPYNEDDGVAPINVYGASKAAGEAEIRRHLDRYVILRTSWIYGVHGVNFVKTVLRVVDEGRDLRVVSDQRGCPTAAGDLAAAIATITGRLQQGMTAWGTYHYCGLGATTWYGFASEILRWREKRDGRHVAALPIPSADYPTAARRPANSELDCTRAIATFGVERPAWQASLRKVLDELGSRPPGTIS